MNATMEHELRSARRPFLTWYGFVGGIFAWAAHLLISYSLVPLACRNNLTVLLYAVTAATALVAVGAVLAAWSGWRGRDTGLEDSATSRRVERFLGLAGLFLSTLFLLVIIVQSLPIFLQTPCDTAGRLGI